MKENNNRIIKFRAWASDELKMLSREDLIDTPVDEVWWIINLYIE